MASSNSLTTGTSGSSWVNGLSTGTSRLVGVALGAASRRVGVALGVEFREPRGVSLGVAPRGVACGVVTSRVGVRRLFGLARIDGGDVTLRIWGLGTGVVLLDFSGRDLKAENLGLLTTCVTSSLPSQALDSSLSK